MFHCSNAKSRMTLDGPKYVIVWVLFAKTLALAPVEESEKQLRIVHVIWRHGARAPLRLFPIDADPDTTKWPYGLGELTTEGMTEQFELGKMLRSRYEGFISKYSTESVYVRSTDNNRTIVSALVNLAGTFPSENGHSPLNNSWQPIPVHTVPRRLDKTLDLTYSYCPYPDSIFYSDVMRSPPVQKLMDDNAELFEFLRNQTGFKLETFTDIYDVYDPLNCERFHYEDSSIPSWVSEDMFRKIEDLFKLSTLYYYSHPIIRRFRGGPLLEDIATLLMRKANGTVSEQLKYVAYSAHETTLIGLLTNLDVYDVSLVPEFSACLMFELYFVNGSYFVELWYKNGIKERPYRIQLPSCPDPCNVKQFAQMAQGRAPQNWYKDCRAIDDYDESYAGLSDYAKTVIAITVFVGSVVAIASAGFGIFLTCRYRKRKSSRLAISDSLK